jgi:hypothetical protein
MIDGKSALQSSNRDEDTPSRLGFLGRTGIWAGALAAGRLGNDQAGADSRVEPATWVQQFIDRFGRTPPFSFRYGDQPSARLLVRWRLVHRDTPIDSTRTEHTFTWTEPGAGLIARCVLIEYHDFPTVEMPMARGVSRPDHRLDLSNLGNPDHSARVLTGKCDAVWLDHDDGVGAEDTLCFRPQIGYPAIAQRTPSFEAHLAASPLEQRNGIHPVMVAAGVEDAIHIATVAVDSYRPARPLVAAPWMK